ncbi:MAG: DUF4136 domain-containing protein [Pseudomonadota bacterium]
MTRIKWAILALLAITLGACASSFKSDVARFHRLNEVAPGATFAVVPKDPAKRGSLEFEQYAALVRGELTKFGYQPVNAANASDLVVEVDYGISEGEQVIRSRPTAFYGFYGPYGYGYPFYTGYWHGGYLYGAYPFGYGYGSDVYSYTVYTRRLEMDIVRPNPANTRDVVFEGEVRSIGRDNRLPEIMPYLVQAMFTNFPGESGVTKEVVIKLPDREGRY